MAERPSADPPAIITDPESWLSAPEHTSGEWQGRASSSRISVIANHMQIGDGAKLHRHPYAETFVVRKGAVVFKLDGQTVPCREGQVVVVPAGVAHAFWNPGPGILEMIDIHENDVFVTEWLDPATTP